MPILDEIIRTFIEAAPYILLGLFFSGIVQAIIPKEKIRTWMGQNNARSVLVSASAGVPLPLCSCGVIPMAISLYKSGASRGATVAFLISTPETGLDSIMLSLALLDPVMAVARPITAFTTALIAGVMENVLGKNTENSRAKIPEQVKGGCCSSHQESKPKLAVRLTQGFKHAFVDLLGDISGWLILGLILSGVISHLIPNSLVERYLGSGLSSMLLMLLVGLPMYICASASTPVAAALLLKGAAPGAVLVFLLAGPATNMTTMLMVRQFLGTRALVVYLSSIAVCSLLAGWALNSLYPLWGMNMRQGIGQAAHCIDLRWQIASAVILVICMVFSLIKKK